jgi:hypothetical protein
MKQYATTNNAGETYSLYSEKRQRNGTEWMVYYFAKHDNAQGQKVETIPEGYEVVHHPAHGTPSIRKATRT